MPAEFSPYLQLQLALKYGLIHGIWQPLKAFWQLSTSLLRPLFLFSGLLLWVLLFSIGAYTAYLLQSLPAIEPASGVSLANRTISSATISNPEANPLFLHIKQQAQARIAQRLLESDSHQLASPWLSLEHVSREALYSVMLKSDAQFFRHHGIDYQALVDALGENIKRRQWQFAAPTISQQTASAIWLDDQPSVSDKVREFILASRLEQSLSKREILELYFNLAEFGPDIYGLNAAAQYYFRRRADTLNAAEGAFLALLQAAPQAHYYALVKNDDWSPALRKKMQRILRELRIRDYIDDEQFMQYQHWQYQSLSKPQAPVKRSSKQRKPTLVARKPQRAT